jgi:uncharacterized protein YraI
MPAQSILKQFRAQRTALVAALVLFALVLTPGMSVAQTTDEWTAYTASDLNLRKGPGGSDAIFAVIPVGTRVERVNGTITNDYAPVTYNGITGWVFNGGLVATPEEVELANASAAPTDNELELFGNNLRVTLEPLMLRSGPDVEAEPILGMPQGSEVTLTQEGYENGYVTVDYGGEQGWAYADLLGKPDSATP